MSEEKVLTLRGKKAVWAPGGGSGPIDPKRLPEGYPYKEIVPETIIDNETISFVDQDGMPMDTTHSFEVVAGREYKVIWDGTEYNCTAIDFGGQAAAFGNLSMFGMEDTGEPFLVMSNAAQTMLVCLTGEGEHTVTIITYKVEYHTADPNYLPLVTEENVGAIKLYHFKEYYAKVSDMKEAVDALNAGCAKIKWRNSDVLCARMDSSDNLYVIYRDEPGFWYKHEANEMTGVGQAYSHTLFTFEPINMVRADALYLGDYRILINSDGTLKAVNDGT